MMKLRRKETDLTCRWVVVDGKIAVDATCKRIKWLISEYLEKVATDWSGWEVLYRDPQDGRYWELTYPYGEMHGGGPPRLTCLSTEQAQRKYGDLTSESASKLKNDNE